MAKSDSRSYVKQSDVPRASLEEALRVATAIAESFASEPTRPLRVAEAMELAPKGGRFRNLCGASVAYGLTEGGAWASEIALTDLGKQVVRPKETGARLEAKRNALLNPRIVSDFLTKYDGSPIPEGEIALNVLEDMDVPRKRAKDVLELIVEQSEEVGFVREISGKNYIDLDDADGERRGRGKKEVEETTDDGAIDEKVSPRDPTLFESTEATASENGRATLPENVKRRVFITHGKNKKFVDTIKKLLGYGEMEPVVSTERQSVSQPVPDKVINDMRRCAAAIIHVDAEKKLIDQEANEHVVLNPNVLMEIGAAMALYGRRFILLVKEGVDLPSNLQGLYEVRYDSERLSGDATIRLLDAINDIKNHDLPPVRSA